MKVAPDVMAVISGDGNMYFYNVDSGVSSKKTVPLEGVSENQSWALGVCSSAVFLKKLFSSHSH